MPRLAIVWTTSKNNTQKWNVVRLKEISLPISITVTIPAVTISINRPSVLVLCLYPSVWQTSHNITDVKWSLNSEIKKIFEFASLTFDIRFLHCKCKPTEKRHRAVYMACTIVSNCNEPWAEISEHWCSYLHPDHNSVVAVHIYYHYIVKVRQHLILAVHKFFPITYLRYTYAILPYPCLPSVDLIMTK